MSLQISRIQLFTSRELLKKQVGIVHRTILEENNVEKQHEVKKCCHSNILTRNLRTYNEKTSIKSLRNKVALWKNENNQAKEF